MIVCSGPSIRDFSLGYSFFPLNGFDKVTLGYILSGVCGDFNEIHLQGYMGRGGSTMMATNDEEVMALFEYISMTFLG